MSESALILRARGGDEAAFCALLDEYAGLLQSISGRYFAPGLEREDLDQEACLGFMAAIENYRPGQSFGGFVRVCAERRVMSAVTAAHRGKRAIHNTAKSIDDRPRDDDGEALPALEGVLTNGRSAHDEAVDREEFRALVGGIHRLTPLEYDAIIGQYFEGRSLAEVADRGEITIKSVDNASQRGKRKLAAAA